MIRRILETLARSGSRDLSSGIDPSGGVSWRLTGAALEAAVGGWQRTLRERGVGRGDRVALEVARGPDLLPAHLAVLATGAVAVPLNPSLSAVERERVIGRADLRTLLAADDGRGADAAPELAEVRDDDPALLIFTSGTTGEPKGVPLTHGNLEANLAALASAWALGPSDRILHTLPAHHVHGLVLALYGSVRSGVEIVLADRFDADLCLRALQSRAITLFMGVPTMYHRMIGSDERPDLRAMRLFVSGSAPLSVEDFRAFERRFGHAPVERYGLSETLIVSSNPLEGERRPGAAGFPLERTELRLADDGEIQVRSPSVMPGYWRDPDASAAVFDDGFFHTGDLGELDADGYLRIRGRKKELILVGGSNVIPGEVEAAISGDPGVDELAVAGVPDADRGECVVAFVVARDGESTAAVRDRLEERARDALAPYKRPRDYRFVRALPRNAMGKIDRRALAKD